ncbi:MAG: TonB-dependent receptor [Bacteroidota bacterium]|nr:TonB-dependent receptor [Bacteroidota bacterium]
MEKSLRTFFMCIIFLLVSVSVTFSQQRIVKGTVKDEKGATLTGVTVLVKGTTVGTQTGLDGEYTIAVPAENSTLVFSFLGYSTQELTANSATIDVIMKERASVLNEVVVIGYGTLKKSDLTGSISQIKASDLNQKPVSSVDNLLIGRSAGVQVLSSNGEPGSSTTIRIRGNNSLTGSNSPLYVVDGVPLGDAGNLIQVNPNDIESLDVLKDASATAIYGSKAANGVIMVTTKKGKINQSVIEVNASVSLAALPKPLDIISDPYLYAQLDNEANDNANAIASKFGTATYTKYYDGANHYGTYYPSLWEIQSGAWKYKTYWPDLIYRTGKTQDYSVAARGGSDKTQYSVSLGYMNSDGIVIGNNYEKYTGSFKLNQNLRKNLSVGVDAKLAVTNNKHSGAAGSEGRSPVFPAVDSLGNYVSVGLQDYYNPLANVAKILNKSNSFDIIATGYADWQIIDGLTLHSNLSLKSGRSKSDYYEPTDYGTTGVLFSGYASQNLYNDMNIVNDNYLTYKKTYAEKHNLNFTLGTSYEYYIQNNEKLEGEGFPNDALTDENFAAATTKVINNGVTPQFTSVLNSYFGRAIYNYADKYLVTLTLRADGSSKFGPNNKWGYFPSGAVAWNVDKESFFPKTRVISGLKIRASYGVTGNQNIPAYSTMDQLGTGSYWNGTSWVSGYGPGLLDYGDAQSRKYYKGFANKDLKWESTRMYNLGTDFSLMDERIHVTADYYDKKTSDLLYKVSIATSTGYDTQWQNVASTSNKGYEFALDANIVKTHDFSWDFGFNISHNKNKVLKVASHTTSPVHLNTPYIEALRGYANWVMVGQPIDEFYGYKTTGIIQTEDQGLAAGLSGAMAQPGEIAYVGYNHGDTAKTTLGSPEPKFFFGLNSTVRYKGFDLEISCNGSYGNKIANFQRFNQGSSKYKRWTPDNPNNEYPSLVTGRAAYFCDLFIEDGSYFKIQNIALGYTFNLKKATWIKNFRLYVNCDNIWTFTKFSGYDPVTGPGSIGDAYVSGTGGLYNGGYPRPRTFTSGINFTF